MLLSEHIKQCQDALAEHGDLKAITSIDEGNGYREVYYAPSIGYLNDGEFMTEEHIEEYCEEYELDDDEKAEYKINAVCVN